MTHSGVTEKATMGTHESCIGGSLYSLYLAAPPRRLVFLNLFAVYLLSGGDPHEFSNFSELPECCEFTVSFKIFSVCV